MNMPIYTEQNYLMHLIGASLVELFPKLQLLDLEVYPDRVMIDFSFSRELSLEEVNMLKTRFLQKVKDGELGEVREMVSKNACDLLKYHKQLFLTDLVDREEMFAPIFCMDPYHAPLIGDIDLKKSNVVDVKIDMYDLGEKKWMKRAVHHYKMEVFPFYSTKDKERLQKLCAQEDHQDLGRKNKWFWVDSGLQFFSKKGEEEFLNFIDSLASFFGERVFFDGNEEDFFHLTNISEFYNIEEVSGDFAEIDYGLKETETQRVVHAWSFSKKDLFKTFLEWVDKYNFSVKIDGDKCFVYDFKGIPWLVAEKEDGSKYFSITINMQCLFAIFLEKKLLE